VLERRVDWAADAGLTGVVREFGSTLLRELDYTIEAYNTRRLERVLAKIDGVHVPAVEPALSSGHVLTLEFIDGVKSTDTHAMDAAGLDRQELARNLVRGAVQMVMVDGFFHADPHPGNVVVELASGRLTFLDAGMVGQLDLRKRVRFARFLLAYRDKDISDLARTLRSLSEPFREPNESAFQREFEQRIGPLIDQPPGRTVPMQKLVSEAVDVLRDNGYRLDPELTLAAKAVAQAEAITSALVPEAEASDFAQLGGAALEELVPKAVTRDAIRSTARKQAIFAVGELAERLPLLEVAAARWADQLAKGEIPIAVRFSDLDRYSKRLESLARLIAAAILLTGLLIGAAIAATTGAGNSVFRTDVSDAALVVCLAAMAVAVALVVVLLWRLVRPEGRRTATQPPRG
jgi:ubiquinone biosynthesis protein